MHVKIFLLVLVLVFDGTILNAQEKAALSLDQKRNVITYLISSHQIESDTSQWRRYLDAIEYSQLFSSPHGENRLYVFSSTSPHSMSSFLILNGIQEVIVGPNFSDENRKKLMNFFKRSADEGSKELLSTIDKIIDIYETNTVGSKIPVGPK